MTTQDRVFEFVQSYVTEHGQGPSLRQICDHVGLASTGSVHAHLRALRSQGRIKWKPNKPGSLTLAPEAAS